MPDIDEVYFRKYLNDPLSVSSASVAETNNYSAVETIDTWYFRKWLNDPGAAPSGLSLGTLTNPELATLTNAELGGLTN